VNRRRQNDPDGGQGTHQRQRADSSGSSHYLGLFAYTAYARGFYIHERISRYTNTPKAISLSHYIFLFFSPRNPLPRCIGETQAPRADLRVYTYRYTGNEYRDSTT
jgi:hypothetical protein